MTRLQGLSDAYSRLGRPADAASVLCEFRNVLARHDRIAHLTHVMRFNHRDTTAGLELARLVEEDGRSTQARAYYEQLVRQSPRDPRTRRALAGFYTRSGRREQARLVLQTSYIP